MGKRLLGLMGGVSLIVVLVAVLAACTGPEGKQGSPGGQGAPGVAGPQGPQGAVGPVGATGRAGAAGPAGPPGVPGVTGSQGSAGPAGAAGPAGKDVPIAPEARELALAVAVSKPANGTHFVAGEAATLTITVKDQQGKVFDRAKDFGQLRLMAAGPIETADTTTPVKLLKTSANRADAIHHYVDLKTNADVQVSGTTLTYKLQPVSDEKPGTYIASVWAIPTANPFQQDMKVAEFQVGTATVEKQIVEKEKCAQCHLGADSGKFYFHHIDQVSAASPAGNFSLDQNAVRNCKTCHNNEGYAAYRGDINNPVGDRLTSTARTPDPIVRRVHGVHMGEGLKNTFNTDAKTGDFKTPEDYTGVVFPANVKNCTMCHVDDRWKTKPSQLACGACHDNAWFGAPAAMPNTFKAHTGGQATDADCATCHRPDGTAKTAISVAHKVEWVFKNTVELALSAPANGKFYVAGEKPTVTITIKDAATGNPIDPKTIVDPADAAKVVAGEWRRANLFVSGPRVDTEPVLTSAAAARNPNEFYAENDLRLHKDAKKDDPKATRTATSIVYQLADVKGLKPGTYTAFVEVTPSAVLGGWQFVNFQVGTETADKKVATNCTQCHGDNRQHPEFFAVKYDTDICKNCHDYERQAQTVGWNIPGGWNGYGAQPIVRKVHGLHFGRYLTSPEDVVLPVLRKPANPNGFDFSETIFPQDVRNCTKCHSSDTTGTWKTEPKRLACLACHDSPKAIAHAGLQTQDPTPAEAYNGDGVETCAVCHGSGREFSPDKVHNISKPFKPPYIREPAE